MGLFFNNKIKEGKVYEKYEDVIELLEKNEGYRVEIVEGGYMFLKDIPEAPKQIIDNERSRFLDNIKVKDKKKSNNSTITNNYTNYNNYQSAKGYQNWSR